MSAAFFSSRWVDPPAHVTELDGSALPQGFAAAGAAAGLKRDGPDVGVLSAEGQTASAARFTANALVGAPVAVSRAAALDRLQAIVANSGGANVGDGERGLATALAARDAAADALSADPDRIGLASTGVIGRELWRDRLVAGVRSAAGALEGDADSFSRAILTTDTGPKRACLDVALPAGSVRLAAQAKGAGMISPRFATMFCFIETDADVDPQTLDLLTGVTVKRSFERISVDGQLSTSDTVYAIANGASGVRVEAETDDELALGEAMDALLRQLALMIVRDGEGAERAGRVVVRGAPEIVEPVARSVAGSPLVKTALNGGDPNFGRVAQAVGQVLAGGEFVVDIAIEGMQLVSAGVDVPLTGDELARLEAAVRADEVEYEVTVPGEGGETEVFFSDLSHGYVTVNAEYTT